MKVNVPLILYITQFFIYCCFERSRVAIINLNQPTTTYTVVGSSLVFHHPTELTMSTTQLWVLQCSGKGKDGSKEGRKYVADVGVKRTSLRLVFRHRNLLNFTKIYSYIGQNITVLIFRWLDKSVRLAASGSRAVIWTGPVYTLAVVPHYTVESLACNYTGQNPYWKYDSRAARQELHCLLWNMGVHFRVHKSPPLDLNYH
jgi:hypothetical protein